MRHGLPPLLLCLLALGGCSLSPRALGLTGAVPPSPPRHADDATVTAPGLPDPGGTYGSGTYGTTGSGRYYSTP